MFSFHTIAAISTLVQSKHCQNFLVLSLLLFQPHKTQYAKCKAGQAHGLQQQRRSDGKQYVQLCDWDSSVSILPSLLSRQGLKGDIQGLGYSRNSESHWRSILSKCLHAAKTKLHLSTSPQSSSSITSHLTASQYSNSKTNLRGTWTVHVFFKLAWIIHPVTKLLVSTNASQESHCINRLTKISCFHIVLHIMNLTSISPEA